MFNKRIVTSVALVIALSGCNRSPASYVARGNKYVAQGKYDDAFIQYRNALKKDPNYADAIYRVALLELRQDRFALAYQSLKRAVELNPGFRLATIQFGDLSWMIYRGEKRPTPQLYNDLAQVSQRLLASNPKDFDGLRFKAYLAIVDKRVDDALALLRTANSIQPLYSEVVMPIAQLLIEKGELAEAESWLRQMMAKDPSYGSSYEVLYGLYMREKRVADAEAVLRLRVEKNPRHTGALLQLAEHYASQQNTAAMNTTLQRLRDQRAVLTGARMALGEFYALHRNPDESLRVFQQAIQEDPNNEMAYRKKMVTVLVAQGKRGLAETNLDLILKSNPNDVEARRLKAGFDLATRQQQKASEAANIYKELTSQRPNDPDLRFYYARSLLASGDARAARAQLSTAMQQNPNSIAPKLALAALSISEGQFTGAIDLTNGILEQNPTNETARLLHAVAMAGLGQRQSARGDLERLLREHPGSEDAELQLGLLDVAEKRYEEATKIFTKYYQPGQTDQRPLEGLIRSDVTQHQFDKALALLDQEVQKSPKSNSARLMLALVASSAGKFDVAEAQYRTMASQSDSSATQIQWAELLHAKGDSQGAIAHLRRARELDSKNGSAAALLGREFEKAGRFPEAIASYRDALKADPNSVFALNNLAFVLAESGQNLDEALQMALSAQKLMKDNNPVVADTVGWVYLKKGLTGSALLIFQNDVKKEPKNPTYRFHLAAAWLASGDRLKAKEELQKALQSNPSQAEEPAIRQLLAKIG